MLIDIVSDLHGSFPKLDGGDLLILAGDYTRSDTSLGYFQFKEWLNAQNYKKKILIGGNHDMHLEEGNICIDVGQPRFTSDWIDCIWLNDSGCEWAGLTFWGSPWTAWFEGINPRCKAWTLTGDKKLAKKWALIPDDIDILITHSPPFGIRDEVIKDDRIQSVGSESLLYRVLDIKPELHIFGHVHEGYGEVKGNHTHYINASHMDVNYFPANKPIRISC